MCGICGTTTNNKEKVTAMNTALAHRGPDSSEVYEGEGVTLGHRRLAIIDLSERASQPMVSADGRYIITYNGELYNYQELKAELQGKYQFKTESDTEVLLAAYSVWSEGMFSKLRGIFAFGIWDAKEKSLLLARDHMGVKPLYYAVENSVLTFASELSVFTDTHSKLDERSVALYLSLMYVPSPHTMLQGVEKLASGHMLRFKNGAHEVVSFLDTTKKFGHVSNEDLYDTIDTAVKRQMISDRPVGAYLSGGFDSSIVLHHMSKHSNHVRTYSVGFEMAEGAESEAGKFNADARLAERTAEVYGAEHTALTVTLEDIRNSIETACQSVGEPSSNATAVTQYLLSKRVREDDVVVVLGGDGGDELFGGYPRHRIIMGAYLFQKMPHMLQSLAGMMHKRVGKLSTPFFTPMHMALMADTDAHVNAFLSKDMHAESQVKEFFDNYYAHTTTKGRHPLDVFMKVDRQTWLADECFIRSDFASMAHGVELRVPLVDLDVVASADSISVWRKTLPHEGKRVLRHTYRGKLPEHIYREPKRGWLSPAAKWFRDPVIGKFAREVYSSNYYNGLDGLFDWGSVQQLLDDHVNKRGYHLYPLWNVLLLQIWAKKHGVRF
jgi:asparagine synthase (glutamine-hydrolysing)